MRPTATCTTLLVTFTVALLFGCASAPQPAEIIQLAAPAPSRSPFSEPPGVLFAQVTQANISTTTCVPRWTVTVRPPTSFTQSLKRTMLTRAGLSPNDAIAYELDHFVPLAVGGHPRSEGNLWLQKWDGLWNAKIKDRLERKLQVMVCAGEITLDAARIAIQRDWHGALWRVNLDARRATIWMRTESRRRDDARPLIVAGVI